MISEVASRLALIALFLSSHNHFLLVSGFSDGIITRGTTHHDYRLVGNVWHYSSSSKLNILSRRRQSHLQASTSTVTQPDDYETATLTSQKKERKNHRHHHHHHHHHRKGRYQIRSKREKIRQMFREAKTLERRGQWRDASSTLKEILKLDPRDSYSHLALARLESRRERKETYTTSDDQEGQSSPVETPARKAFQLGTSLCPKSIHLWQAWALYEQSHNNFGKATDLFHKALELDDSNPYVCHAFGLFQERVHNNHTAAQELWNRSLNKGRSSAALVCSLGESLVSCGQVQHAKKLYAKQVHKLKDERELTEVYLAAAWLEEKKLHDMDRAVQLLKRALTMNPRNSRALVALARLEGRIWEQKKQTKQMNDDVKNDNNNNNDVLVDSKHAAMRNNYQKACEMLERDILAGKITNNDDGRLFNAWAKMEVQVGAVKTAREILRKGISLFHNDHSVGHC